MKNDREFGKVDAYRPSQLNGVLCLEYLGEIACWKILKDVKQISTHAEMGADDELGAEHVSC